MSENLYPAPTSSMSQPERVLPSLVNCTTNGEGLLGPSDNWNLANKEPTPTKRVLLRDNSQQNILDITLEIVFKVNVQNRTY